MQDSCCCDHRHVRVKRSEEITDRQGWYLGPLCMHVDDHCVIDTVLLKYMQLGKKPSPN